MIWKAVSTDVLAAFFYNMFLLFQLLIKSPKKVVHLFP